MEGKRRDEEKIPDGLVVVVEEVMMVNFPLAPSLLSLRPAAPALRFFLARRI